MLEFSGHGIKPRYYAGGFSALARQSLTAAQTDEPPLSPIASFFRVRDTQAAVLLRCTVPLALPSITPRVRLAVPCQPGC